MVQPNNKVPANSHWIIPNPYSIPALAWSTRSLDWNCWYRLDISAISCLLYLYSYSTKVAIISSYFQNSSTAAVVSLVGATERLPFPRSSGIQQLGVFQYPSRLIIEKFSISNNSSIQTSNTASMYIRKKKKVLTACVPWHIRNRHKRGNEVV